MERMRLRWIVRNSEDFGSGMSEAIQLGYENVLLPFNCCAVGILVAAGMSLMERVFPKVAKREDLKSPFSIPTSP